MANSHRQTVNYTPRMTDEEAYEALPPKIRAALQDSVNEWSSYLTLRYFRKLNEQLGRRKATTEIIKWIRSGDKNFMEKGFIPRKGFRAKVPSPCIECDVPPLYSR